MSLCFVFYCKTNESSILVRSDYKKLEGTNFHQCHPPLLWLESMIYFVCLNIKTLRFSVCFGRILFLISFLLNAVLFHCIFMEERELKDIYTLCIFWVYVFFCISPQIFCWIYFILSLFTFLLLTFPNVFMLCGFSLQRIHDVFAFSIPL